MLWTALVSSALAGLPEQKCATLQLLDGLPRHRFAPVDGVIGVPNKSLTERDVLCQGCSNTKKSEHFIIRWGSGVSNNQAQEVLDYFEYAWEQVVDNWSYPPPVGTDQYYFNVYIGDSGPNTPDGYGAAGYFYVDQENMPFIVIARQTLDDMAYAKTTIVHEFYHAIQGVTNRYAYDSLTSGSWFWEATANWIEGQAFPNDPYLGVFLAGYVFFPHYPANYFNYPDEGTLEEYYQYGAFIFPQHISEHGPGASIIRSAWLDTSVSSNDPMEVMDVYLQEKGTSITEQWLEHIGFMVTLDYQDRQIFQMWLDEYAAIYTESNNVIALRSDGLTNGWVSGPDHLTPYHFGHNRLQFEELEGPVTFAVDFEDGSLGSKANVGAILVRESSSLLTYTELEVDAERAYAELNIQDAKRHETFTLVVGVWADRWEDNKVYEETFSYRFQASEGELIDEEGNLDGGETDPELDSNAPPVRTTTFYGKEGSDCQGCSALNSSGRLWVMHGFLLSFCLLRRQKK